MEKKLEAKLKPTMLDPSLLCAVDFWKKIIALQKIFPIIYVPKSIKQMKDSEFRDFYGSYLYRRKTLSVEEVVKRSLESFRLFSWEEYLSEMPDRFRVGFGNLRRGLEKTYIAESIQKALLDEFVFLTTRSSILSRLKKPFKLFEKFDALPLLNLEKRAPEEWKKSVRGVKNAVNLINWIASIVKFSLLLGPLVGPVVGSTVTGVRILLVDPAPEI